jgi:hypothetical protein
MHLINWIYAYRRLAQTTDFDLVRRYALKPTNFITAYRGISWTVQDLEEQKPYTFNTSLFERIISQTNKLHKRTSFTNEQASQTNKLHKRTSFTNEQASQTNKLELNTYIPQSWTYSDEVALDVASNGHLGCVMQTTLEPRHILTDITMETNKDPNKPLIKKHEVIAEPLQQQSCFIHHFRNERAWKKVLKERERGIVHHAHRSKECMTNEFC